MHDARPVVKPLNRDKRATFTCSDQPMGPAKASGDRLQVSGTWSSRGNGMMSSSSVGWDRNHIDFAAEAIDASRFGATSASRAEEHGSQI
ncbi:hypothetical protein SVAN01_02893 [Stagonosporopsis vannaccii]|nr:hypothetical protein SVAN01_02893 [Stagonosporopsis vannaccii]